MNINRISSRSFKKSLSRLIPILLSLSLLIGCGSSKPSDPTDTSVSDTQDSVFTITASFYPMHILAMNLTEGIPNVREASMADANIGCIHDHTFTTDDLSKIEGSDVYIENGLGLEVFNDKLKEAYPDMTVIDASGDITDVILIGDETNGHVWTDPTLYLKQIHYVSAQLQKLDPKHRSEYAANENTYQEKIQALIDDHQEIIDSASGKKALVLDETLPYLCRYLKVEYITITTDHEQESISAEQLKSAIKTMQEQNITAIFVTKDTDLKTAQAIASETGATIYEFNSCMTGKEDPDAYLDDMKENLELLSTVH